MACSPEELSRLADLLSQRIPGESTIFEITEDLRPKSAALGEAMRKMGILSNMRTVRGAFGDEFAFKVIDPVLRNEIGIGNFYAKEAAGVFDSMKGLATGLLSRARLSIFGLRAEVDQRLYTALRDTTKGGKYTGPSGVLTPQELEAVKGIRVKMDRLEDTYGVSFDKFIAYNDLRRMYPEGILREGVDAPAVTAFRSKLTESELEYFRGLERKGIIYAPDATLTQTTSHYIRSVADSQIRRPFMERIEKEVVNPYFGVSYYKSPDGTTSTIADGNVAYQAWRETVNYLHGGATQRELQMADGIRQLIESASLGKIQDPRIAYRLGQAISSLYYAGAMGSPVGARPGTLIRNMSQMVPAMAELGPKYAAIGIKKTFEKGNLADLEARGFITSELSNLLHEVGLAGQAGRAISSVTEASLKMFTASEKLLRGMVVNGALAKFDDTIAQGAKLPMLKTRREEILQLIQRGKIEEARDRYAFAVNADINYIYGRGNRPSSQRGVIAQLAGMFTAYPLNTFEMYRMFGKRAVEGVQEGNYAEALPAIRLLMMNLGLLYAGKEFLNVDLSSMFLTGAFPNALAIPSLAMHGYQVGKTSYESVFGNVMLGGETDFHKHIRQEAVRNMARDLQPFIPGGVFFFQDVPKILDSRNLQTDLKSVFGFPPLPEEANRIMREKQRERRLESSSGTTPTRGYGR